MKNSKVTAGRLPRARRRVALALCTVMIGAGLQAVAGAPPVARADGTGRPGLPAAENPVAGSAVHTSARRVAPSGPRTPKQRPKTEWPKARTVTVSVTEAPGDGTTKTGAALTRAAGTPLTLFSATEPRRAAKGPAAGAGAGVTGAVTVTVRDRRSAQRAGVEGVLFTLKPQVGTRGPAPDTRSDTGARGRLADPVPPARRASRSEVGVSLNYSAFSGAFGGSYASRLSLVELPACALTTPDKAACRSGEPVATRNDTEKHTLSAQRVPLRAESPTVLAAVAEGQGRTGDYQATDLAPSATWGTNVNTGDFTWSYDIPVPEVPGGLKPNVGLSYSSGAIDGRTGSSNNQGSWAGDGFDLWPGFIERRYTPCADDGAKHADGSKPGDLCWGYDNAFVSFNGKSGELVPAADGEWRFKNDDGTKIKKLTSADRDNGDNDNEYWRLTAPDGTRFYFGHHKLPGWTTGADTTDSTWTVPVYGNNVGEPCHKDTFENSWCRQAWRWNLDYAVDPHGNAIAYYYGRESNSYGRNLNKDDDTPYIRGGYLRHIDYGLTSSHVYTDKAPARVTFTNAERCLPETGVTCAADTIDAKAPYWYDTPWDLNCTAGTACDRGRLSPTFWTRKRLTAVTTEVLKDGAYAKVDSWALAHRWGTADVDRQLELESVQHTGHTGTTPVTLPKTTFAYTQLVNRLDKTGDGYAPFVKDRLSTVADEYGGQIDANYSAPACEEGNLPTPESNTTRCYPQYIGGSSSADPDREWFNKYVVTSVTTTDRTGGAPDQVTRYSYLDGAAWHYDDDDGLTKEKFKTWSQWRGYPHVRIRTGGQGTSADAMRTQEDRYFLRGMDNDRSSTSGGTKTVQIALGAGEGEPLTDHASAAGFAYKTVLYSAPGGTVLHKSVSRPWHHQTAEKKRAWGTVTANFTGTAHHRTWTSLDDGAGAKWRTTTTATTYDTVAGRVTRIDDRGDDSTPDDDRCVRTSYATNADTNLLTLPAREETVAVNCDSRPDRAKQVISDNRTAYDGGAYGTAPSKGDATASAKLKKHDGTTATYLESGATYDSYGRRLSVTDVTADLTSSGTGSPSRTERTDGRTSTTVYSPATGVPTKVTETTPPASPGDSTSAQTGVTELDPLRGQPSAKVDTNGKRTEFRYDALGRAWMVWLPNRQTSSLPSYQFTYLVEDGKPNAVATRVLTPSGGAQIVSYTLYDGYQRPRQTQEPGPNGGRILTDTFYDERGLVSRTFAPYYTEGKPDRALFKPSDALSVETQTRHTYDGLGRETESRSIAGNGDGGKVLSVTNTLYGGDRTTVIPPDGETATTTLNDARGRITELRHHHTRAADASYDTTRYAHTPRGELAKVTDPAGNSWTYTYDQLGRQIRTTDPDRGTTTAAFDDRGLQIATTDDRGVTLATVYDGLGRRTALRDRDANGTLRAQWVYDTVPGAKGRLAESTRFVDGNAYTRKITQYDPLYQPQRTATVIPAAEGPLAGTYQEGTAYHTNGLVRGRSFSAAGSLPGGGWTYTYEDQTLRPLTVYDGQGISTATSYSLTGKPLQYALGGTGGARKTWVTNTYEWGTQRLATSRVDRQDVAGVDQHATYGYDQAGNVTSTSDVSRSGTDTQCFTYDYLRRLTQAWTQSATSCAAAPSKDLIGGPAPYWQTFTYDTTGNRTALTRHDPTGDTTKDTKSTYTYPAPGTPQPHTLSSVTTTGPTGTATHSYTYDAVGNTASRTLAGDKQTLRWDAEGRLAAVTTPSGESGHTTTSYLYDADGNRLLTRSSGKTTLHLGDHTEVTLAKGADKPTATRYIALGGGHQAVLSNDGTYTLTLADPHGTGQLAVRTSDLALTQRRSLPFGSPRGETPAAWPGTKGFVGGTDDTADTGFVHLGAREYDPATGRFLSVDPVMDLTDPQQMNGYTYSNNNPQTFSDPDGNLFANPDGSGSGTGVVNNRNGKNYGGMRLSGTPDYRSNSPASRPGYRHPYNSFTSGAGLGTTAGRQAAAQYKCGCAHPERTAPREPSWDPAAVESFIADAIGVTDIENCLTGGEASGCAWAIVGFLPIGKFKAAAKAWEDLSRGSTAIKATESGISKTKKVDPCHSFPPGTEVALANGEERNIEDIKTGDKVIATDPKTGRTTTREVVATIITQDDKHFTDITVKTPAGPSSVIATDTHPFWSTDQKKWINAGDLRPGTTLRTPTGTTAKVSAVRHYDKRRRTYDLTVAETHTYYVLAGATPVLVHNSNGWCGVGSAEAQDIIKNAKGYGSGLKRDAGHRAADFVVDDIAKKGVTTRLVGGDGVERLLVQMPGEMNGKAGRFEWLVERGGSGNLITHQRFVNGGTVNGIPNKP